MLVGDRGFCSFAHLALLLARGAHAVFRMHQKQIVDFTPGRPHASPRDKKAPAGGRGRAGCARWACSTRWSSGSNPRLVRCG